MKKIILDFLKRKLKSIQLFPIIFSGGNYPLRFLKLCLREIAKPEFYLYKNGKAYYPGSIILHPTLRCNLRCRGCSYHGENGIYLNRIENPMEKEMTLNEMKRFVDEVADFSSMILLSGGGEPFLRPDLVDLVEYIKSRKIFCLIVTNGACVDMDEELAERLIHCKLDMLIFSIDGLRDIHEELRGTRGIFDKIISNLQLVSKVRKAQKVKYPLLQINYTLFQENYLTMRDFAEYISKISDLEIDTLAFRHPVYLEREDALLHKGIIKEKFGVDSDWVMGQVISNININPQKLREEIKLLKKENKKYKFTIEFEPELNGREKAYYSFNYRHGEKRCYRFWYQAVVDADGNVQCCNDVFLGNIRFSSLKDIWNNEMALSFRKFLRKGSFPSCKRCCGHS